MRMTKILLCGCLGTMGRAVTELVQAREDCKIVAGVDHAEGSASYPVFRDIDAVDVPADVLIDFSHPSLLTPILGFAAEHGSLPAVLCTTGYDAEQTAAVQAASEHLPIFYSRNMSLGVNLLIELAKQAAKVLDDGFDIEIVEKHHNKKIDAPSGTALMIADAVSSARETPSRYVFDRHAVRRSREKEEIGISSVRGGTIVGEHEVIFAGNHEVLTLSHSAQSKALFAAGAVNAAMFMVGKGPGLYDMSDLLAAK